MPPGSWAKMDLLLEKMIAKPEVKEVLAAVFLVITHFVCIDLLAFFLQPLLSVVWPCAIAAFRGKLFEVARSNQAARHHVGGVPGRARLLLLRRRSSAF